MGIMCVYPFFLDHCPTTSFFQMCQMCSEVSSNQTHQKVKEVLESSEQDDLRKAIELAWKFVTLPNPLTSANQRVLILGYTTQRVITGIASMQIHPNSYTLDQLYFGTMRVY